MTHSTTAVGGTNNDDEEYYGEERDVVTAEVGRAALVELRSAGGFDLIVGDEGEKIRR